MNGNNFVRQLDIDLLSKTLEFHQQFEGDVSCVVWDASIVLAKYLEKLCETQPNYLKNRKVLELGSGVGCVGLVAASLGANVILTDLPEALPLINLNIKTNNVSLSENGGTAQALPLKWGEPFNFKFGFDLILLADCIYYQESINSLLKTLIELTGEKTEIIMSQEMRDSDIQKEHWQNFLKAAEEKFDISYIPRKEQNVEYSSEDIKLLKLVKRIL